MERTSKLIY